MRNGHAAFWLIFFTLFIGTLYLSAEAYIEGPWLWMIASGGDINSDQLAAASQGRLTENLVAAYGVNEGDTVGKLQWTRGRILPEIDCLVWQWGCYSDNVNSVVNRIGLSNDRGLNYHSAYALINIISSRRTEKRRYGRWKRRLGQGLAQWQSGSCKQCE